MMLGIVPPPAFSNVAVGSRSPPLPVLGQLVGVLVVLLDLPLSVILFSVNLLGGYLGGRPGARKLGGRLDESAD